MFIDCSKLPDPAKPHRDDVYVADGGARTVVVLAGTPFAREHDDFVEITVAINGVSTTCPQGHLPGILASIGARPWGRLDRSSATRAQLTKDPALVQDRLTAMGPHLRAMREQYGLSMGDLARSLGCPPTRLSMLELGEPDSVRERPGVREDEGRAALAELLADAVAKMFIPRTRFSPARPRAFAGLASTRSGRESPARRACRSTTRPRS